MLWQLADRPGVRAAKTAVAVAKSTNRTISKLGASSLKIGKLIKGISSIAQRTNLLAPNATIAAAGPPATPQKPQSNSAANPLLPL